MVTFDKKAWADFLNRAIEQITGGNITEFGKLCDVTRPTLSYYLNQQKDNRPRKTMVLKIALVCESFGYNKDEVLRLAGYSTRRSDIASKNIDSNSPEYLLAQRLMKVFIDSGMIEDGEHPTVEEIEKIAEIVKANIQLQKKLETM